MKRIKVVVTARISDMQSVTEMVGYVDGYVRGGDNVPYVCVVFPTFIEMIPMNCLGVLDDGTDFIQAEDVAPINK